MRPRPLLWLIVSVLCFAGVFYFWHLGEQWAAQRASPPAADHGPRTTDHGPANATRGVPATPALPAATKAQAGALDSATASQVVTNYAFSTNRLAFRLTNTTATISQLQRSDSAILLENALLDTAKGAPVIPSHLLAKGDPGTWIVQSHGPINNAFRSLLQSAGASIISYIPNNAYLVRAPKAVADQLQADPQTQAVLPYEPYYKLKPSLLSFAVSQTPLPANSALNVLLFADAADKTSTALQELGAEILGAPERTPFGPAIIVRSPMIPAGQSPALNPGAMLSAIAGLPGVQEVEWALVRTSANDLSRVRIGVAVDPFATTNYLGLTGTNVLVNVNDSGIDATHPDLAPRVFGNSAIALVDPNGHGTHVAGIIASSGGKSSTVTNASGPFGPYSGTNNQFRGIAPNASLFSVPFDMTTGPFHDGETLSWPSDVRLQETPAQTNAFISNNSWNYTGGDDYPSYDLHAASYDAAVRDALPTVPGSQPLLIVFSAGNAGGGSDDGSGGTPDTILSPATAKNVITVGAIEQYRNITNIVIDLNGNQTTPWLGMTDSSNQVASFSSRGNVGVGIEGKYGRFKPDVVAPGTFVISTRSQQWDQGAYYNPTSHLYYPHLDWSIAPNVTNAIPTYPFYVPFNAVQWILSVAPNTNSPIPFPGLPIYVRQDGLITNTPGLYDAKATNLLSLPPDHALIVDSHWNYGIGNDTTQTVAFDFFMDVAVTNQLGDYLDVLRTNLNDPIGPYYRYESGTSMAAADVSGTLALMQEFFQQRLGRTTSPALMKALLINGARSLGGSYDFTTQPTNSSGSTGNSQGWGLINLPTTLQPALTNSGGTSNSIVLIDQDPATALATGQSKTYHLSLSPTAQTQPLRVTLVWTDPPGNPVASVKLVNDLDLVVTSLDTSNLVYYGNDIGQGNDFNQAWQSNTVPNVDTVNNVENVFLNPAAGINGLLSSNYSVTITGYRVNVNAVTAQTNNVSQDYALVISTGDGLIPGATITLDTTAPVVSVLQPQVTPITNTFGATSSDFSGGILYNQRAGANTQLLGTNTIPLTNDANAVLTVGVTNQWHFYVITNNTGFTNAAFLTFTPPTLSIPRMGVYAASVDNATRPEADIDLYVAPPAIPNNWALTNLDTNVLAATDKSLGRGGTETVVYSNATGGVYYFGVKCEDQMAAQYAILGVFSRLPFGTTDLNGDQSLIGIPTFQPIPDGTPLNPPFAQIIAISVQPITVRRVIVTNVIEHQLMTDLLGNLTHSSQFDVLNNHTCPTDSSGNCLTYYQFIYDDSQEKNVGGAQPSDGPGSLHNFVALDGVGPWILTMTDNQPNNIGTNVALNIFLERQPDLTAPGGVIVTIQPGGCREDYVTLPPNAVSLTAEAGIVTAAQPILFSIELCPFNGTTCKSTLVTNALGGSVTIDLTDTPPLQPGGTYTVRVCNMSLTPITLNLHATIGFSLSTLFPSFSQAVTTPQPISDDAVTDFYLTNTSHGIISSVDLGLLINSPRVSDYAITLVSPNGTRVLLFENRGAGSTNGIGTFNIITNSVMQAFYTNNFDIAPVGLYAPGAMFQGWSVLSNTVDVLDDFTCLCLSNHILALLDGAVSNMLPTTSSLPLTNSVPSTNANSYRLSFKVNHLPWLDGMVTWWPLDTDGSDIFGGMNGLLQGDVAFSAGQSVPFRDDFTGPLNPNWQAYLPTTGTGGNPSMIETYIGSPGYFFTNIGGSGVIEMTNQLSAQERVGWRTALSYTAQSFRYEVRFNTLNQGPGLGVGAPVEIWILDALNLNRYDVVALYDGDTGTPRGVLAGNTIDTTNNTLPYTYANNTWYRLVIAGSVGQNVRASLLNDAGTELVGQTFAHGPSAFSQGFRLGLSQFLAGGSNASPVYVAVDSATLTTTLSGEVNQAYFGDGEATRMIVPGCQELDLGLGHGFSIEGWVWPGNIATPAPLLEWFNPNPPTNQSPFGVQFWLALTNGPGSFGATIWDTNMLPHVITTTTNALTNGGWQHVALTYDTNSGVAALYVNGLTTNNVPLVSTNLGHFVPQTSGDVYIGFDPAVVPTPINYPTFASTAGLNLVGSAMQLGNVMRLTPAAPNQLGNVWALNKQPCAAGFITSFEFQISNPGAGGADGLGFVVQDQGLTSSIWGGQSPWTNYVAVFFNTAYNWPGCTNLGCDISGNSVGIMTNNLYASQVDLTPLKINLKDGNVHQGRVVFDGSSLSVWLDGMMLFTNVPIPTMASVADAAGKAWVGFGAFCGAAWENQDILNWTFGRAQTGTSLQGGLDEFSLYNRALTPCEVGAIYHAGSGGKYGTNVLVCPVVTEVTLSNTLSGVQTFTFTNGLSWVTNGPHWETNTILFSTGTNPTPIVVRGLNPYSTNDPYAGDNLNAVVDDFVLSDVVQQGFDGLLYFTDNTNLTTIPIKFAPTPYTTTNFPPVLIYTNNFSYATAAVYQVGATILGAANGPGIGPRDWTVTAGPVTVISNTFLDLVSTNCLAMATGAVQCLLPTIPGHLYELTYAIRGPCAVGWWNGSVDPLSQRAQDLISGNNGAFLNGATNTTPGYVGPQGLFLSGQSEPPPPLDPDYWTADPDDPAGQIEIGDPPQLQLTNAFTIEGWIQPLVPTNATVCGTEQIFFRGYPEPFDCSGLGDPYWLALEPTTDKTRYDIHFHIADAHYGTVGADALTTNAPVIIGSGSNSGWWHLAAVFDKPFTNITVVSNGTNVVTFAANQMRIYLNGVLVASNYTTISPYKDLDPSLNPGVDIGERCRYDWTQPFYGFMDEVTVYARALTAPEISAIAGLGALGKADLATVPPAQSLAKASVSVDGIQRGTGFGDNSQWTIQTVQFTALDTNAIVNIQSLLPGTLLDGITLSELPPELYYLPEESLSTLGGQDSFGVWTLEIWDSRAGITNTVSQLADWQINFHLTPSNPPPVITLEHGILYTNSLAAYSAQYFIVPMPQWATFATNILQFAELVHTTAPLPATVYFNPTNFPALTDVALLGGPAYPDTVTLSTNTTPFVTVGQPYYLLVTNPNPVGLTFGVQVGFDITTLNNCQMLVSNVVSQAGIPRYFQFEVPGNLAGSGLPPQAVSFWVSNTACNLKVVLSEHLPLPDLDHYDYISQQPCTNDQVVMLVTNSTPFPLQTNRWYVGVFNTSSTNVLCSVEACMTLPYPLIIPLTNGIPFTASATNATFSAPPGPPRSFFFDFLDLPQALGVLFELYNLSGDADLVLQQDVPPTMFPYFATSFASGTNAEQIVLRTDSSRPSSVYVPDLRGLWYLGVFNNEQTNIGYTIRATLPDSDRLLPSGQPMRLSLAPMAPPHGLLLSWNSVIGERYFVQYTPSIAPPIIWTNLGTVLATTPLTTFEVLPVPPSGGFFRVVAVYDLQPFLHIQQVPTNSVRLYWSTAYLGFRLQYKNGILGFWSNLTTTPYPPYPPYPPAVQEGLNWAAYDRADSTVPKFYRLIQP